MVNNSQCSSPTTRKVRLTREWTRTYTVDVEDIRIVHGSARLGVHVTTLSLAAERTLQKNTRPVSGNGKPLRREVTLNVAPHTKSEIIFSWNEIRKKGFVHVVTERSEAWVPYDVVVGLTFDQQQIDAPEEGLL